MQVFNPDVLKFVGLINSVPLLKNIYHDWHYIPPAEVEPILVSDILEFLLKRLFYV